MNPLTQIKNTQKASQREIVEGIKGSWHDRYKHSAYIFAGGLPFELTEGDLLAVFSQYGELVDVNLCRDRKTGKSRGFAFLAYMDQRSTVLAVDNLSGARVAGRVVRVEHVDNYRKKKAEMTGEPESESDEEGPGPSGAAAAAAGGSGAPRWGHEGYEEQRGQGGGGGGAGGGGDEPWAASNSVFALLNEARAAPLQLPPRAGERGTAAATGEEEGRKKSKKEKKEKKKHKKEKKEKCKKDKHGEPSSGSEGSPARGGAAEEGGRFGPRRPPAPPVAAAGGERERPGPARPPVRGDDRELDRERVRPPRSHSRSRSRGERRRDDRDGRRERGDRGGGRDSYRPRSRSPRRDERRRYDEPERRGRGRSRSR